MKVYTLSFSEEADQELLSEIAQGTDAVSWYSQSADEIHKSFADLFLVVKKPQIVPLTSKGFKIDADVREATFYVNNQESAEEISLKTPEGEIIPRGTNREGFKWFQGKKFDVITIDAPEVGTWEIVGIPNTDGFATVLTD